MKDKKSSDKKNSTKKRSKEDILDPDKVKAPEKGEPGSAGGGPILGY